jgi:hypothetical protein
LTVCPFRQIVCEKFRAEELMFQPGGHWKGHGVPLVAGAAVAMLASACVYDGSDRCSPSQSLSAGVCVCAPGFGFDAGAGACVVCGDHQQVVSGVCACVSGWVLDATTRQCVPDFPGLGAACTASTACTHAEFPTCHQQGGGSGYCTTEGCTGDPDCHAGYKCDLVASPAYCRRPTLGEGTTCTSDDDCASFEATWCAIGITPRACAQRDCTLGASDQCFVGEICCDMAAYAAFGVPATLCTPPTACPSP